MTTNRTLTLAAAVVAAFAAGLVAPGCGSKSCGDQTPTVSQAPTATCSVAPGAAVTVQMHVCPKCDQGPATCLVHAENAAAGTITLEPVSEVCDPSSSCAIVDPATCPFATLNCQFNAPANTGDITVTIVTPGTPDYFKLAVTSGAPGSVTCPL